MPRRFVRSKVARKIFPFLGTFRSQARDDDGQSRVEQPPLNVATTVEQFNYDNGSFSFEKNSPDSLPEETVSAPIVPTVAKAVNIAKVSTIPSATARVVISDSPKWSNESVKVTSVTQIQKMPSISVGMLIFD